MAAENYVLLERIELNASAASVTFANIPGTGYTDLKIVVSSRTTDTTTAGSITFNGTGTGFTGIRLFGSGSSVASGSSTAAVLTNSSGYTASTYSNSEIYIPNYAGSNYKSVSVDGVSENNATESYAMFNAILWSDTAAITSVTLAPAGGSFVQYSTFSLYGLAAVGTTPVIAPKASGGNIDYDGTYWIHTFLTSGTFTPQTGLTCDYLVVAGGGGGGALSAGGGGAGGLRSTVTATGGGGTLESALTCSIGTSYTVTVGAGGAGAPVSGSGDIAGTSGNNSVFSTITSTGGGGGGSNNATVDGVLSQGRIGGSGGGNASRVVAAVSGTANQGFAGGANTAGGGGTGGGGAGVAGTGTSSGNTGAAGGNGVAVSITGSSVTYAGGGGGGGAGGGGAAGTGGGGAGRGNVTTAGGDGTVNTGGGGGASGFLNPNYGAGGTGGSGIVIIRYLAA